MSFEFTRTRSKKQSRQHLNHVHKDAATSHADARSDGTIEQERERDVKQERQTNSQAFHREREWGIWDRLRPQETAAAESDALSDEES